MTPSSKKTICFVIIAFLGVISAIIARPWKLLPSPPKLVLESEEIDLGVFDPGTHEFQLTIRNDGGGLLTLSEIRPSCASCTSVSKCDPIPGGETGTVTGKVSVAPGSHTISVVLVSNAPEGAHVVTLSWFGKKAPQLVPSEIEISAKPNAIYHQQIRIVHASGQNLQIIGVSNSKVVFNWKTSSPSAGQHRGPKLVADKGRIETQLLSLDISAPEDVGEHSVPITLRCRQGMTDYELPLLLRFVVLGGIYTKPRKIFLGGANAQSLVGKSFSVNVFTDSKVSEVIVQSKPEFLECKIKKDKRFGSCQHILEGKVISRLPEKLEEFSIILRNSSGESFVLVGKLIVGTSSS